MKEVMVTAERVSFRSGGFLLEGVLSYAEDGRGGDVAVLVNPHPCLGGTMENNVMLALDAELTRRGVTSLRFNFRGVGRSESDTPLEAQIAAFWETQSIPRDGGSALADLRAAVAFVGEAIPEAQRLLLVGYSFGAVIALLGAESMRGVDGLAMISPPIHQLAEPWPSVSPRRIALARGGDDLGVEETAFAELAHAFNGKAKMLVHPESDHFHIGIEATLAGEVVEALFADE